MVRDYLVQHQLSRRFVTASVEEAQRASGEVLRHQVGFVSTDPLLARDAAGLLGGPHAISFSLFSTVAAPFATERGPQAIISDAAGQGLKQAVRCAFVDALLGLLYEPLGRAIEVRSEPSSVAVAVGRDVIGNRGNH